MYKIALLQKRKFHRGNKKELSKLYSTSVATALEADILTPSISPKEGKEYDLMINWGLSGSSQPEWASNYFKSYPNTLIANDFPSVAIASNKLKSFKMFEKYNNSCPDGERFPYPIYFTNLDDASEYLSSNEGSMIFCRQKLQSHSGSGIVVASTVEELVPCALYTVRFPKRWEFRLHVAFNKIIRVQQKKKLGFEEMEARGIPQNNGYIRNSAFGYVFSTQVNYEPLTGGSDRVTNTDIGRAAINAVNCLGLAFGAVDIGVHKEGGFTVFEVNTSPGLEEDSVNSYVNAFRDALGLPPVDL